MNKKVLLLSSSPRKGGNSGLLCDQFTLEPQPWAIISNITNDDQKEILTEQIDNLVRNPC
jgi:hypothetical protein